MDILKLTAVDRSVISAAHLDAEQDVASIARRAGCRTHVARYSLEKLCTEGVLEKRWLIDSYRLGWARCTIFIATAPTTKANRTNFSKFLRNHPRAAFVAEIGGGYDYLISMFVQHWKEVLDFQEVIAAKFGDIVLSKSIALRNSISFFQRSYSAGQISKRESITFMNPSSLEVASPEESRLLSQLVNSQEKSLRQLAARLKLPLATLAYRLDSLRQRKILHGATYDVHSERFGARSFVLLLYAKGLRANLRRELFAFAAASAYPIHFLEGVGEWDFDFDIEVEDTAQLQEFKEALEETFRESLREIKVIPIFKVLASSSFPRE